METYRTNRKHHLSANLDKMIVSYGEKYKNVNLEDFLNQTDIFTSMKYDILKVNRKYKTKFEHMEKDMRKSKYGTLYIDDVPFITDEFMEKIDTHTYRISIPNISVVSKANNLITALSKHSKKNKVTGKVDFDASQLDNKTLNERVMICYDYFKSKMTLPHFIYYEALVYVLLKDKNDIKSRATQESTDVVLTHIDDIINMPAKNDNITSGLVHGQINKSLSNIHPRTKPHEFDILYYPIIDKKEQQDIFTILNATLSGIDLDQANIEGDMI